MNTKTRLRDGVSYDINELLNTNYADGAQRSCLSCEHFDEPTEICRKFSQRPPARIIVLSCEHYEDNNDIPF